MLASAVIEPVAGRRPPCEVEDTATSIVIGGGLVVLILAIGFGLRVPYTWPTTSATPVPWAPSDAARQEFQLTH